MTAVALETCEIPLVQSVWDRAGEPLRIERERCTPLLDEGEVLVEIELATICGSDLHTASGDRPGPAPSVLGHEQVGRVLAVAGPGRVSITGTPVRPGDRVVWTVTSSCGHCDRCLRDVPQKCRQLRKFGHELRTEADALNGGLASHCIVPAGAGVMHMLEDVPAAVAAPTSCATATVAAALDAAGTLAGRRVLVTGAGMLGVTATAMAALAGAHVVLAEPDLSRRSLAAEFGAQEILDPAELAPAGFEVAVEMSGHPDAVRTCLTALDVAGTAVLVGSVSPGPAVPFDPEHLVRGLHTITGVHNYRPRHLASAVDFIAAQHGRFPFVDLVGPPHPLAEVNSAFAAGGRGEHAREAVRP